MRQLRLVACTGLACCLALSSFTWALGQQRKETRTRSTVEIRRSSLYIGAAVRLHAGSGFGKVHEFIISDDGCVEFVIVEYERRYVPIPWVVTSFDFGERVLILDIDEGRIKEIPTFTEFTELSNTEFVQKVKTFHKVESRTTERRKSSQSKSKDGKEGDRPKTKETKDEKSKAKDQPSKDQPGKTEKKSSTEKKTGSEKNTGDKDKPDEKKTGEKKTGEKKTDEKKSGEKKSDEKKSDEKKDKPDGK